MEAISESISISTHDYARLIELETRVDVLIDILKEKNCISKKDIYLVLGYPKEFHKLKATEELERLKERVKE